MDNNEPEVQSTKVITRPEDSLASTFQYASIKTSTSALQIRPPTETSDFSAAAAQFDQPSSVRPLFGSQASSRESVTPDETFTSTRVSPLPISNNRPDLQNLKIALIETPVPSATAQLREKNGDPMYESSTRSILEPSKDACTRPTDSTKDQSQDTNSRTKGSFNEWHTPVDWNFTSIPTATKQSKQRNSDHTRPSQQKAYNGDAAPRRVRSAQSDIPRTRDKRNSVENDKIRTPVPPGSMGRSLTTGTRKRARPVELDETIGVDSSLSQPRALVDHSLMPHVDLTSDAPEIQVLQSLAALRIANAGLRTSLAEREERLSIMTAELTESRLELDAAKKSISSQSVDLQQLQSTHSSLIVKVDSLKVAHVNFDKCMQNISGQCDSISHRLKSFDDSLDVLIGEISDNRQVIESTMRHSGDRFMRISQMKTSLSEIRLSQEAEALRCSSLQAICDRNAGVMSEDRDRLCELSSQVTMLIENMNQAEEASKVKIADREKRIVELSDEALDLQAKIETTNAEALQRVMLGLDNLRTGQAAEIAQSRNEMTALQSKIDCQQKELRQLEIDNTIKTGEIAAHMKEIDTLKVQVAHEQDRLQSRQAEVDKLLAETKYLRSEAQQAELHHESKIKHIQESQKEAVNQDLSRLHGECEALRRGLHDRQQRVITLEAASTHHTEAVASLQLHIAATTEKHTEALQKAHDDFALQRSYLQQQSDHIRAQEVMNLENQIKALEAKSNLLEETEKSLQECLQMRSKLTAELEEMRLKSVDDAKLIEKLRIQQTTDSAAVKMLSEENRDLKLRIEQGEVLRAKNMEDIKALEVRIQSSSRQVNILDNVQSQNSSRIEETQAEAGSGFANQIKDSLCHPKESPQTHFASLNMPSDPLSECDDPTVYDIIGDTPPQIKLAGGNSVQLKERNLNKRRSLPLQLGHDVVKTGLLENVKVNQAGKDLDRITQRDEKGGRKFNSTRGGGYKKRKSNS